MAASKQINLLTVYALVQPIAIRVMPDVNTDRLRPQSRLNYGKIYTIEHNVPVRPFGVVHADSARALTLQFNQVLQQAGRNVVAGPTEAAAAAVRARPALTAYPPASTAYPPASDNARGAVGPAYPTRARNAQATPPAAPGAAGTKQELKQRIGLMAAGLLERDGTMSREDALRSAARIVSQQQANANAAAKSDPEDQDSNEDEDEDDDDSE